MIKDAKEIIPQYKIYTMKPEELIVVLILAMGFCFGVGLVFYDNVLLSAVLSLAGIAYIPLRRKKQLEKRIEALKIQFKDALYFLSVSLSAGKSFENALLDAQKSLGGIYAGEECDMLKELEIMNGRILMNEPVEKLFSELASRTGIDDIKSFSEVIMISKRAGANLVEVIKNTTATLREKIEIRQEIDNLIAGKKLEQKVLTVMPFAMVFFLKNSSPGFLDPLMSTVLGHVIMTVALLMILIGQLLAQKVVKIEV